MAISSARLDELKKKFDENPRRYFAPLANEYRKLGDLTQAIALCRAHLPNQPGHISGHIVLAQALYEARELGESRGIFEAALDLDPENLIALRYLGDIAREQGEPLQARGWYERVLDADPRNDEIAALLRALDEERERASVAAEAAPAPFAPGYDETASAGDGAGDDFAPTVIEERFPFAHATTGEQVAQAQADDPFFGEAEAAPTIAAGDLEAVAEPSVDDWFAAPAPAAAPQGVAAPEAYAASAGEASTSEIEASLGFESIDLAANDTATADGLEESFFPDLASVTPPASPLIAGVATPIDVHAVTPPFLVAQPENASSIPTPSFLQSIAEESQAELAAAAEPQAELSAADGPAGATDAIEVESGAGTAPQAAHGELPDAWELSAADFDVDTPATAEIAPAAATPVASEWELPRESAPAPVAELPSASESSETFVPFDSFVIDEAPAAELAVDAMEPAVVADDTVGAIDTVDAVESADVAYAVDAVDAIDAVESIEVYDGAQSSADELEPPSAPAIEGFEAGEFVASQAGEFVASQDGEFVAAQADDFASEPSDDLDVEYGEFIAPAADEVPYIASSISVPLDEPDAYTIGAPELSAHEPFPIEEQYRDDDFSTTPVVTASPTPSWNEAHPFAADATPVEGFEPHDVVPQDAAALEEFAAEAVAAGDGADARSAALHDAEATAAASGTPFVTETMAELYLQQGFTDEALAIYRQLLATNPDDESLVQRVAALERGAHSAVVEGVAPRDHADRVGQSVRNFFSHFARRQPRHRRSPSRRDDEVAEGGPFAGVATREEALTVPDERDAAPQPVATLTQLFQGGPVSTADERAASALAGAFGGEGADEPGSAREGQLSLEHLFRDVPARSSGAVTLDEFYEGSTPQDANDASGGANGEPDADIEQFTAWLEGLKKK